MRSSQLANTLREEGALDERACFIDATFAAAKGGGDAVGLTKRGTGVKILAIVDRQGLPLSVSTHAANHHEVTLVQLRAAHLIRGLRRGLHREEIIREARRWPRAWFS